MDESVEADLDIIRNVLQSRKVLEYVHIDFLKYLLTTKYKGSKWRVDFVVLELEGMFQLNLPYKLSDHDQTILGGISTEASIPDQVALYWPYASTSDVPRDCVHYQDSSSPPFKKIRIDDSEQQSQALEFHLKILQAYPKMHIAFAAAQAANFVAQKQTLKAVDDYIDSCKADESKYVQSGQVWARTNKMSSLSGQLYLFLLDQFQKFLIQYFPDMDPYFMKHKINLGDSEYFNAPLNYRTRDDFLKRRAIEERNFTVFQFLRSKVKIALLHLPRAVRCVNESMHRYVPHKGNLLRQREKVDNYLERTKETRDRAVHLAEQNRSLFKECPNCCNDKCVAMDLVTCSQKHAFCRSCVRSHAEIKIGLREDHIPCLESGCSSEYSLELLKDVMENPINFQRLAERRQAETLLFSHC